MSFGDFFFYKRSSQTRYSEHLLSQYRALVLDDDVAATVENFDSIEMSVFIFTSFFLLFLYTYTLIAKIIASAQDIDERYVRHR